MKDIHHLVTVASRRLFPAPILVAQLLERHFSPHPREKHDDTLSQAHFSEALVALPPIWHLVLDDLFTDIRRKHKNAMADTQGGRRRKEEKKQSAD